MSTRAPQCIGIAADEEANPLSSHCAHLAGRAVVTHSENVMSIVVAQNGGRVIGVVPQLDLVVSRATLKRTEGSSVEK